MPTATVLPGAIPLALDGGALTTTAGVDGVSGTLAVVVDTGTPLTAYDDGAVTASSAHAGAGHFRLFSAEQPPSPRLDLFDVPLFATPLAALGAGDAPFEVSAVLGGDNLSRFAATFDYRVSPTLSLVPRVTTCSCALADDCQAVLPFSLEGGQLTLKLGSDLYTYPSTRVVLDACLEPLADPLQRDIPCATPPPGSPDIVTWPLDAHYQPSGLDVRLIVASGFPGFALSQSAWARLRGQGAVSALTGQAALHLPDPDDAQLAAGTGTVGGSGDVAALALVSREDYWGPCGELARSRRQRRIPKDYRIPESDPRFNERFCPRSRASGDPLWEACNSATSGSTVCNDDDSPVAAVIELDTELPVYVLPDTSPILVGINEDVRPSRATVDGIIGTEVLKRLVTTIDYPYGRVVARCAGSDGCLTYPRYVNGDDCSVPCKTGSFCGPRCRPTRCLYLSPESVSDCPPLPGHGGACPPAP